MGPVVQHTGERPLDEVTLQIYPGRASSRFELYEDDGRTNAYRRGQHALTAFECSTGAEGVTVRIGESTGGRSAGPASRRYVLEMRMDRPQAVTVAGLGELPRMADPGQAGAGWWADAGGFVGVRLPDRCPAPITVMLRP